VSGDKTPLINKLLLVALVLNLGCLVIIIIQLKSRNAAESRPTLTSQNTPEQPQEGEIPEPASPPRFVPGRPMRKAVNPAPLQSDRPDEGAIAQTRTEAQAGGGRPV